MPFTVFRVDLTELITRESEEGLVGVSAVPVEIQRCFEAVEQRGLLEQGWVVVVVVVAASADQCFSFAAVCTAYRDLKSRSRRCKTRLILVSAGGPVGGMQLTRPSLQAWTSTLATTATMQISTSSAVSLSRFSDFCRSRCCRRSCMMI